MSDPAVLSGPLDVMTLGEFEPEVWVPARAGIGQRGVIGLAELAGMDVVHGPRRASPVTYDAWLEVLRSVRPGFEFTDPPLRHSLPVALAFAATADRLDRGADRSAAHRPANRRRNVRPGARGGSGTTWSGCASTGAR